MPMIDGANGRLHYLDEGRGDPPVVLLHAFPLTARMWEPQFEALAPSHRVVAPDLIGFGGSDVPAERSAYSVEAWADDVAALFAALGLERAVVVGLSMGGYVAFAFLRRRPEALAGLLLADTRAGADTDEIRSRREQQQELLEAVGHPVDSPTGCSAHSWGLRRADVKRYSPPPGTCWRSTGPTE